MYPRPWLLTTVTLFGIALVGSGATAAPTARPAAAEQSAIAAPFNFQSVEHLAAERAAAPYQDHGPPVPASLVHLSLAQYQSIRFRPERALWHNQALFEVQLFHRGFTFTRRVRITEVVDGKQHAITYDPTMFDFSNIPPPSGLPTNFGFAGLRIHYPLNRPDYKDEVLSFLGASYFRLLGRGQSYGASVRGLAIDVAGAHGEEFPYFTHFWLVRPGPTQRMLTMYALLDSPSVTGAYRFELWPSTQSQLAVTATLYTRKAIHQLGIAPLTSMYLYGQGDTGRFRRGFYPQIHDDDGLMMQAGDGEWIWRPLENPRSLRISTFSDDNPRGFGLSQRDRNFADYQDERVHYESMPSYWVAPLSPWGKGHFELVEIPSRDPINDNIVAFWVPAKALRAHQTFRFSFLLSAYLHSPVWPHGGRTVATRTAPAGGGGRFMQVDFAGGDLTGLASSQPVQAKIDSTGGRVDEVSVQDIPQLGTWRVSFRVRPGGSQAVDLRCYLTLYGEALTETWTYVWTP